ncbi:hypothetical protein [Solidesulfovibrio sp.]
MPRVLDAERNVLEIEDKISGDILEVHYRMPENSQRVRYSNALTVRKGGKVKIAKDIFTIQAGFGFELLTGIKKGDFVIGGRAFASEPGDPDFDPKWKEHVRAGASDVLAYLARTVFGAVDKPSDGVEFEDLETPEEDFSLDATGDVEAAAPEATADPLSGR